MTTVLMYFEFPLSDVISVYEFEAVEDTEMQCLLCKLKEYTISTDKNPLHYDQPPSHILPIPSSVQLQSLPLLFLSQIIHTVHSKLLYIFTMVKLNVALLASGLFSTLVAAAPAPLEAAAYLHFPDHAVCPISESLLTILLK